VIHLRNDESMMVEIVDSGWFSRGFLLFIHCGESFQPVYRDARRFMNTAHMTIIVTITLSNFPPLLVSLIDFGNNWRTLKYIHGRMIWESCSTLFWQTTWWKLDFMT
jgi:hypothetical protein